MASPEEANVLQSEIASDESYLEPHLKYLLNNMMTEYDVQHVETLKNSSHPQKQDEHAEVAKYVEKTKRDKFLERYSTFSLVPDPDEQTPMSCLQRSDAFEKILCEEKLRRSSTGSIGSLSSLAYTRMQEPSEEMQRFLKVKRRLEQVKKYCPSLYQTKEDIIQIWGNLKDASD